MPKSEKMTKFEAEKSSDFQVAGCLGAAPSKLSFGDSAGVLTRSLFKWRRQSAECRLLTSMQHQNLQIRTKRFALQVIQFCECLPKDETSKILARQLL